MTLEPALMAVFGGLLFRRVPLRLRRSGARDPQARRARFTAARVAAMRPMALLIAAACTVSLLAAAWVARDLRLGSPLIRELPASATAARASTAASDGFAPGILSPTEVLVIGPGVTRQTAALARLQRELAAQPGVAELAGPVNFPDEPGEPDATGLGPTGRSAVRPGCPACGSRWPARLR
jgi:RND superfamily putative drug exporter